MSSLRQKVFYIIFTTRGKWAKIFDIVLLILIFLSVLTVILESVDSLGGAYPQVFLILEWAFTLLFTIEYGLRLWSTRNKSAYAFSFYGIIDLLSILPTYLSLFIGGTHYLVTIRALRLFRIFRIFKLVQFMQGHRTLAASLRASLPKITVFLVFLLLLVSVLGALLYVIESTHPESGFKNIPLSIYWAIVTLTTVGYGDISPITPLGKFIASIVMILGYSIIAVPTGIISVEMNKARTKVSCPNCGEADLPESSKFCPNCGNQIPLNFD